MKRIFTTAQGLRSGWVLAIFIFLYSILTLGAQFSFATIPALRAWAARQPHGVIAPVVQIEFTGLELLILVVSVAVTVMDWRRPATGGRVFSKAGPLALGWGPC